MCIPSNANLVFHRKLCNIKIKGKEDAAQCDIWIHMRCKKLDHFDDKNFQDPGGPRYCISCWSYSVSFEALSNKTLSSKYKKLFIIKTFAKDFPFI